MYHVTVHPVPKDGRQTPVAEPPGCHLHSFVYASPERIICIWEQVGALPDEWGGAVSVSIPELAGTA